jgi:hypothetical protein
MTRWWITGLALAALTGLSLGQAQAEEYTAELTGFEEVGGLTGPTGAILSNRTGTLNLNVFKNAIAYTLSYSGTGTPVTQAHIHFGKIHVAGGIMAFLCTNHGNGPPGTPAGPPSSGTVSGTITAASIVGPTAQNVPIGDFGAILTALETDTAYGNIHTTQFPSGEIRGQVTLANKGQHKGQQ